MLGIDYTWNLIPGLPDFFSLNRFIFFGVIAADMLLYSEKYIQVRKIYICCGIIFIGCIPYFVFGKGPWYDISLEPGLKLIGCFSYLLFFYVNCRDAKIAGRISTVLLLSSGVMAVYVLGSELGMLGGKIQRWRGTVEFTSASGIFDPNIITLNYLPVFAFAPFLRTRWRKNHGEFVDLYSMIFVCFCLATFFLLNTRAGSLSVAASLTVALILRFIIVAKGKRGGRLSVIIFSVGVIGALVYTNMQYNILGSIIGIWGETNLATDSSFAVRLASYRYLIQELSSSPNVFGSGYQSYWSATGWEGFWPHSVFVDIYIQGGLLFLFTYLYLFSDAMVASVRGVLNGQNLTEKCCFAGYFCFMVGLIPLAATLTIGGYKLPWAVLGCALGLSADRRSGIGEYR